MKRIFISVALLAAIGFTACKNGGEKSVVLTKEISFKKEGTVQLKKANTDSLLVQLDVEFAQGEYETQTGLMYRKSMQKNHSMLFIFEDEIRRSFYMKNTEFSLDIIYINSQKKVVSIQKNAQPLDQTGLPSEAPVKYVLEVNAGLSDQWGLEAGDLMEFTRD